MEGGSRRQRWINHNNRRPPSGKPPQSSWHPKTVPSWEKDFCRIIGGFEWHTFLQMKEYMHFYENVIKWNDSAGEEAFHNAKRRYWAKIKGLQCNVPLPDPDLYIQNIDWNAQIAPDVLDSKPESPESGHEPVVIFGDMFYAEQGFSAMGWGDAEEEKPVIPTDNNVKASGWRDSNNNNSNRDDDDKDAWKVRDGGGEDRRWNSNDWSWLYENDKHDNSGEGKSSGGFRNPRVRAYGDHRNHSTWRGDKSGHNNRGRQGNRSQGLDNFSGQRSWVRVGDAWNREKRAS